jgi:transcriptional regulator with XRE-family HTH domain
VESYRCSECGEELIHFGDDPPPSRCEDCIPETGPGSRLLDQLTVNLRRLRESAGIDREELAGRAAMNAGEVSQSEGDAAREPSVTKALRLAHSLGASIDELVERIYWNPGEIAARPAERRPPPERLAGFFLVLPANVPVFESALPRAPVANRHEATAIFGQNIRDARTRRHLTQTTLAQVAGLSKAGLSLIERGVRETTIETLLALARALEVTAESLLGGIAWKPQRPPCARPRRGGAQHHTPRSLDGSVRDLWREGRTAAEIAAAVGASPGSVSAIIHRLREHGQEIPYRNRPTRAVHEGARERRRSGLRKTSDGKADRAVEKAVEPAELTDDDVGTRIGTNVALFRHEAGLTQEQLGEAIESDRTYVHRIEAGRNMPRLALMVKLAAGLNVQCSRITAGVFWRPSSGRFCLDEGATEPKVGIRRLGQNVREARRRLDASQQALGIRAGISRSDIVDFEQGQRNFRIFTAVKLAGALEVDLAGLFSGVEDWYARPLPAPEYAPGDKPPSKAERDALLLRLWREGKPERDIAEILKLAGGSVAPYVRELRDSGIDIPYRRAPRTTMEAAARRRRDGCGLRHRALKSDSEGGSDGCSSELASGGSSEATGTAQRRVGSYRGGRA